MLPLHYRREISSGLHLGKERKFNRIDKYDALFGKILTIECLFYGKNNLTSKYSNFFNCTIESVPDRITRLVSPAIKSDACIEMCR